MKLNKVCLFFLIVLGTRAFSEENQHFVLPEHITNWVGSPYEGPIDVSIWQEDNAIRVHIETEDLTLTSLRMDQLEEYVGLFGDIAAVEKYKDATPWTREEVEMKVCLWIQRWEELQDPFSAFAIFSKKQGPHFIGHLVLGHSARFGQSELAFLLKTEHHNIDYAIQAVSAVVHGYVPQIADKYHVNLHSSVTASPLHTIHSTARFDDTFSGQALIRSGFKIGVEEVLWDAPRFHYLITLERILQKDDLSEDIWIDSEN